MMKTAMREHTTGILVRPGLFIAILLTLIILTSCADATTTVQSIPTPAPTTAATSDSTPTAATADSTPTATTAAGGEVVIKTAQATVDGSTVTILTDAQGKPLYVYSQDTASSVACTGICAQIWPAVQFSGSGQPQASEQLPGQLQVSANANGNQVTYNGHPLYTYVTDSAGGEPTGNGVNNMTVATPDLTPLS